MAKTNTETGIRVKNPLTLPVRVHILDGQTVVGSAVVAPGTTCFIPTPRGTFRLEATIIDPEGGGLYSELGEAKATLKEHLEVKSARPVRAAEKESEDAPIRSLAEIFEELSRKEVKRDDRNGDRN